MYVLMQTDSYIACTFKSRVISGYFLATQWLREKHSKSKTECDLFNICTPQHGS